MALRGKGRPDVEGAMPEPILPVVFGLLPPSLTLLTGIDPIKVAGLHKQTYTNHESAT